MSKSRRRASADTSDIANELDSLLAPPVGPTTPLAPTPFFSLSPTAQALEILDRIAIEDNRTFQPAPQPSRTRTGQRARIRMPSYRQALALPFRAQGLAKQKLGYAHPDNVINCLRRKARKEIMHALKLRKKGSGGAKRKQRSPIKC